jgi:hypothetical protein
MHFFLIVIILLHGLIHLMGFVKSFHLAEVSQLEQDISKPAGIFWLIATILFILTAISLLLIKEGWWITGFIAVIISQVLIVLYWSDARYGTIPNLIIMVPIIISFTGGLPGSYSGLFKTEVEKSLNRYTKQEVLTERDIKHLPSPVQKYIIYSGAIGKEKVQNFRADFHGKIAPKPNGKFQDFRSVQYNFFDKPTRAFYIKSKMFGLPVDGLHLYAEPEASMQIKIAHLLQVVDAKGPEMNQSETVTMFNDMCLLAPATLIDIQYNCKAYQDFFFEQKMKNTVTSGRN